MYEVEGARDLREPLHDLCLGLLPSLLRDAFPEISAGEKLHDGVGRIVVFSPGLDPNNGGMFVGREIPDLLQKALPKSSVHHQPGVRNLDDDLALELLVEGEIDRRHPTSIEGSPDLVATVECLTDEGVFNLTEEEVFSLA